MLDVVAAFIAGSLWPIMLYLVRVYVVTDVRAFRRQRVESARKTNEWCNNVRALASEIRDQWGRIKPQKAEVASNRLVELQSELQSKKKHAPEDIEQELKNKIGNLQHQCELVANEYDVYGPEINLEPYRGYARRKVDKMSTEADELAMMAEDAKVEVPTPITAEILDRIRNLR